MTNLTAEVRFTAEDKGTLALDEEAYHARHGEAIHKWLNNAMTGSASTIITDVSLYYNPAADTAVFITMMSYGVETLSDDCHFSLVTCTGTAGTGTPTDIGGETHMFTGNVQGAGNTNVREFHPPMRVVYSAGVVESISMRVHANDAATIINCGWCGWVEDLTL